MVTTYIVILSGVSDIVVSMVTTSLIILIRGIRQRESMVTTCMVILIRGIRQDDVHGNHIYSYTYQWYQTGWCPW
jgi:hypothetical protein